MKIFELREACLEHCKKMNNSIFLRIVKNTHRERTPSNKTRVLTKGNNVITWIFGELEH